MPALQRAGRGLGPGRALTTGPTRTEGGWRVTGQKVWTSYAQFARWGCAWPAPSRASTGARGLSLLVLDMEAAGVDIRPLVQITGEAEFNEVFLDERLRPDDQPSVGTAGQGWAVASTTLAHERGTNFPFKEEVVHEGYLARLFAEAAAQRHARRSRRGRRPGRRLRVAGGAADPQLAHPLEAGHGRRAGARVELGQAHLVGHDPAAVAGGAGRAWAREAPLTGPWQRQWLWSKAASIAGGTSEVQRNVIGERILGLPREQRR